mgnify:CR=1 FL=1
MPTTTATPPAAPALWPESPAARIAHAVADCLVMTGRNLRHVTRNVENLLLAVALPVIMMLLFVYVFGGAISVTGRYVDYVVPGIVLLCAGYGAALTAPGVAHDMERGIIDRFRSLPITPSAVLVGHVGASVARNLLSTAIVIGVALLTGFRPAADATAWLAALGVLVLYILAMSWAAVALGLLAKTVEGASGFTFVILFLPYLSSAFVPTDTMPAVLRVIAEHQPLTPITETLRALLLGAAPGGDAALAVAWCAGLLLAGYGAAACLFRRRSR